MLDFILVLPRKPKKASKRVWIRPKLNLVHFKCLWLCLFTKSWSSFHSLYAGKRHNGNPISTFPPCYAFQIISLNRHLGLFSLVVAISTTKMEVWNHSSSLTRPNCLLFRLIILHALVPSLGRILKLLLSMIAFRQYFFFLNRLYKAVTQWHIEFLTRLTGQFCRIFPRPGCVEALKAWWVNLIKI